MSMAALFASAVAPSAKAQYGGSPRDRGDSGKQLSFACDGRRELFS
jgi:hypothetical protein